MTEKAVLPTLTIDYRLLHERWRGKNLYPVRGRVVAPIAKRSSTKSTVEE
jgi:hypothetical protein